MEEDNQLRYENRRVLLCKGKGCCPSVSRINEEKVLITDDDNNKVVLTIEQARMLEEAVKLLPDE